MGSIAEIHNPWRDSLIPASFRRVEFHVEMSTRQSGRRTVVHEYPKRDLPYSEDMGRHAVRFAFTGYVLHNDKKLEARGITVVQQRNALYQALEAVDAGMLVHPSQPPMLVMVERYSLSESKQKGGYYEFDMQFVEAGIAALSIADIDTAGVVDQRALAAVQSASDVMNSIMKSLTSNRGIVPFNRPTD